MVVGQPAPWLAQLIESLRVAGEGQHEAAAQLAAQAFEAAPTRAGQIDGVAFEWIADADSRLGPVLEACINGNYYWLPFDHLMSVDFDPPEDLRDSVWMPAHLKLVNGADTVALVPTCYVGSHHSSDGLICLARKTEWQAAAGERYFGLGQRVLTTDQGDHDLMVIRKIEFNAAAEPEAG
jgi:type VI secretion system protein ImpE